MKISESFTSLQGEGRYAGYQMLFIRTSGCSRACDFCDSKYHQNGTEMTEKEVAKLIKRRCKFIRTPYIIRNHKTICFTGGEPLIFVDEILDVISRFNYWFDYRYDFHLETNGDLLSDQVLRDIEGEIIYISISPKMKDVAVKCKHLCERLDSEMYDIKVVTDLDKVGVDMLKYATILMPLTTYNEVKDKQIRKKVWQYCVDNGLRYSPRLHYEVFGQKRGV